MAGDQHGWSETRVEQFMGNLLRAGVLTAAAVVLLGALVYLMRHGNEPTNYRTFQGEPENLRKPTGVVAGVIAGSSRSLIQLGLLLLIATPVLRVAFSVFAFALQRDRTYVVLTLVVLGVLLYSLFGTAG
jgi:uncharacterized membrane protein